MTSRPGCTHRAKGPCKKPARSRLKSTPPSLCRLPDQASEGMALFPLRAVHKGRARIMLITRAKNVLIETKLERINHLLKREGGELVGPCPVCGGRDRFAVNVRRQIWNCRQCAKGGDVIDLVQHVDGVSVREAVATLTGEQARPMRAATAAPATQVDNSDDEWRRLETAHRIWQEAA